MSDDIVISGGGSTQVATATLLSHQQHLAQLADELQGCLSRLSAIDGRVSRARLRAADAPLSSMHAENAMSAAHAALRAARDRARQLADALQRAATLYGSAERQVDRWARDLSATISYQLGFWSPLIGALAFPLVMPFAITAGGALAAGWFITPEATRDNSMQQWLRHNKAVLSDPRFVAVVRLAVSSSDDFTEGVLHIPEPLSRILGDGGLGILGVSSSAAVVVGVASAAGALKETAVRTNLAAVGAGSPPPLGLADRADRIPHGGDQIRIDKYSEPGKPDRFEVYLGGTIDGSLVAGAEPWDMTSNLNGVAGTTAGSLVAARQALQLAGVDANTPVTFTGYSQGGLLAADLAASGDFDTRGLVTFGGPAGAVSVPHDIPYVALEHADDLVPATGGVWKSSDPVLITRTVYGDHPYTGDAILPAHELTNYRHTASLADASDEQRLSTARTALRSFSDGEVSVQTSYYHARRIAG